MVRSAQRPRAQAAMRIQAEFSSYPNPRVVKCQLECGRAGGWVPRARAWKPSVTGMSSATIETFPNPEPGREYEIAISCPEFTSVCPRTGLPDFGEIRITYVPDQHCIELKSLKYYLVEFRNRGIFYEQVTNQVLDDLVAACQPRRMTVIGDFSARGGIKTVVTATYEKP